MAPFMAMRVTLQLSRILLKTKSLFWQGAITGLPHRILEASTREYGNYYLCVLYVLKEESSTSTLLPEGHLQEVLMTEDSFPFLRQSPHDRPLCVR